MSANYILLSFLGDFLLSNVEKILKKKKKFNFFILLSVWKLLYFTKTSKKFGKLSAN
jgi:hypothetical protein